MSRTAKIKAFVKGVYYNVSPKHQSIPEQLPGYVEENELAAEAGYTASQYSDTLLYGLTAVLVALYTALYMGWISPQDVWYAIVSMFGL